MRHIVAVLLATCLACLFQSRSGLADDAKPLPIASDADFASFRSELHSVKVNHQSLGSLIAPMLQYKFSLPEVQLRRGTAYVGSNFRLRRVLMDLMTGRRHVKIGVVGGSITFGTGASVRGKTDWFSVFSNFILESFPNANVTLRNGAVPGTPSLYMIMCLELSIDEDVDIVFTEYQLNDGFENTITNNQIVRTYERLVRRLLAYPRNPAVVMMQTLSHGQGYEPTQPIQNDWKPFHHTMEDMYGSLAQYYDLQYMSLRTAVYRLAAFNKQDNYRWKDFMSEDMFHPGDLGHKTFADLAAWLFQQTAIDLIMRPFGPPELQLLAEPMPPPMYAGNEAPKSALCLHQDLMKRVVMESIGWDYVNEGTEEKPKKGYVSNKPGSVLKMRVNTYRANEDQRGVALPVMVGYLKSYTQMGQATIWCDSGCTCENKTVDSYQEKKESQTYLAVVQASQSPECVIAVRIESGTTSGGHKVKVSGIMIAEMPNEKFEMPEGHWGVTLHAEGERQHSITRQAGGQAKVQIVN